jgi:large subunit ribosomal protein L25
MKSVNLNAFPRTQTRRGEVKKLRDSGRVPAVIYGRQQKPQNLEINYTEFRNLLLHSVSENVLVDLVVKDDARPKRLALVQEIQRHPLEGKFIHVDFHEVAENEHVIVQVPVETSGEAAGVKNDGGVLEHVLHKVKVRALPKDLPETLVLDVTELKIGQSIHIGDIKPPAGVEVLGDKHISVVACAAPITEEQEAAALAASTEAAPGEVEMIKEKKEDGTEGEAAKPGEKAPAKGDAKAAAAKPGEKAPAGDAKAAAKPAEKKK